MTPNRPDIFEYLDSVQFLNAHLAWRKAQTSKFSVAVWAEEIGCSKVTLRFLLQRKRSIATGIIPPLIRSVELTSNEARYFEILVDYSQARSAIQRSALGAELIKMQRSQLARTPIAPLASVVNALAPVLLTALTFSDVEKTPASLAKFLFLDVGAVTETLESLAKDRIVTRLEDNSFSFSERTFFIPDSIQLRSFYEFWIDRSKQALSLPTSVRKYQSLKFALTAEEYQLVVERCQDFAISLLSQFKSDEMRGRTLYMFESCLFPISVFHDFSSGKIGVSANRSQSCFEAK